MYRFNTLNTMCFLNSRINGGDASYLLCLSSAVFSTVYFCTFVSFVAVVMWIYPLRLINVFFVFFFFFWLTDWLLEKQRTESESILDPGTRLAGTIKRKLSSSNHIVQPKLLFMNLTLCNSYEHDIFIIVTTQATIGEILENHRTAVHFTTRNILNILIANFFY